MTSQEQMGEDEYTAYLLTCLFQALNERIDPGLAYPVVLDLVHDGLTEENCSAYAQAILASAAPAPTTRLTH